MTKFYLHNGQEQDGPFDLEELRQKKITKNTPIWHEGITEWTIAGKVPELKELFTTASPPPFKKDPPPINQEAVRPYKIIKPPKTKNAGGSILKKVLIVVGISVLGLVGYYYFAQVSRDNDKTRLRNQISLYVNAERNVYRYSELGGIWGLEITVNNTIGYIMDNVRVKVTYVKSNGETWKEELLDFAYVKPYSSMTLAAPNSNRGTSVRYEIVSIKSTQIGLY